MDFKLEHNLGNDVYICFSMILLMVMKIEEETEARATTRFHSSKVNANSDASCYSVVVLWPDTNDLSLSKSTFP